MSYRVERDITPTANVSATDVTQRARAAPAHAAHSVLRARSTLAFTHLAHQVSTRSLMPARASVPVAAASTQTAAATLIWPVGDR